MSQPLILASSSKYRKCLLQRLGLPFEIKPANIDEQPRLKETASAMVKRLAIAKAKVVASNNPYQWVIGSDQVAAISTEILGKPLTIEAATKQLSQYSGKQMQFITGVALVNHSKNLVFYAPSVVKVKFLTLSAEQIEKYLNIDQPFDCAGSFKIEAMGITLFEWVKSDDPTSLEGLPLIVLCRLLRQAGIEPLIDCKLG